MDLRQFVDVIPEIFLYILPGYIAIKIKEQYGLYKQTDSLNTVLYSMVYSFFVQLLFASIDLIPFQFIENDIVWRQFISLLIAVFLGFLLVKLPKIFIGKAISKLFNKDMEAYSNVFQKAMLEGEGAWATVYLKNNMVYTGKLISYTSDPDDEKRELLLSNFTISFRNIKDVIADENEFLTEIRDNEKDDSSRVFLKIDEVLSIELFYD